MSNRPSLTVEISPTTGPFDAPVWDDETAYVRSFTATRGRQQALDVVQPGTSTIEVDNGDRRFDPNHASGPHYGNLLPGRRGRIRALYGNSHLRIAAAGSYASTPDIAAYTVTDLDVRVDGSLDDYTAAAEQAILSKWDETANQRSWVLGVTAAGFLRLRTSSNGTTTVINVTCSATLASVGIVDGQRIQVRATADVDDGAGNRVVRFYYSTTFDYGERLDEQTSWTQIGTTSTTAGTTSIFDSTALVRVGGIVSGTPILPVGDFYAAALLSGISGTAVFAPVFTNGQRFAADATTGTDLLGRVWTIAGAADLVGKTHDVYGGFAEGWPVPGLELGRSPVPFTDGFSLLAAASRADTDGSPFEDALLDLTPVHWYKLDEASGAETVTDYGTSPADGTVFAAAPTRLGAAGLDPGSAKTSFASASSPKGWIEAGAHAWSSFSFLVDLPAVGAPVQVVWQDTASGRYVAIDGTTSGFPGQVKCVAGATIGRTAARVDNGAAHLVTIVYTGAALIFYIDGVLDAGAVGGASTPGSVSRATIGAGAATPGEYGLDGTVQHVATFSSQLSAAEADRLGDAAVGWTGDTTTTRIGRLLDLSGWPTSERDLDASDVGTLGVAELGADALEDLRALEATEGGAFFQEPDFTMRFLSRYATALDDRSTRVCFTFTDAAGEDRLRFENPIIGAQGEWIRNRVRVAWTGGEITVDDAASQTAYGIREHSIDTVLTSAAQARSLAELVLDRYAEPVVRVESIDLNLAAEPNGWEAALDAEIGDRVRVVWTPGSVGTAIDVEALVDGKTITAGSVGDARATLWLSAAVPSSDLWIWDSSLWDTSTSWG